MEIDSIFYKAKDGRIFTDPLACEEYEKTIGIVKGSVGAMLLDVEKHMPEKKGYVAGLVQVKDGEGVKLWIYAIYCIDDRLESFVNVNNLQPEQRYVSTTVEKLFEDFKDVDHDNPCQYMLLLSTGFNARDCEMWTIANWNQKAWSVKEK